MRGRAEALNDKSVQCVFVCRKPAHPSSCECACARCEMLQQCFWLRCKHTQLTCEVTRVSPHFIALWLSASGLRANTGTCDGAEMSLLGNPCRCSLFLNTLYGTSTRQWRGTEHNKDINTGQRHSKHICSSSGWSSERTCQLHFIPSPQNLPFTEESECLQCCPCD